MGMNVNPMDIINMMKSGQNPQQIMIQMLEERAGSTPMGQNLINLAKNNKTAEVEQVVKQYVEQNGGNYEQQFNAFKSMLGFK